MPAAWTTVCAGELTRGMRGSSPSPVDDRSLPLSVSPNRRCVEKSPLRTGGDDWWMSWVVRFKPARFLLVAVAVLMVGWIVFRHVAGTSDSVTDRQTLATLNSAAPGSIPAGGPAPGVSRTAPPEVSVAVPRVASRVVRREHVAVDGTVVETLVVDSRSTRSGAHPGTRLDTLWWSPALGLPVRWDVDMDIGGVFAFRSRTSLKPVQTTATT